MRAATDAVSLYREELKLGYFYSQGLKPAMRCKPSEELRGAATDARRHYSDHLPCLHQSHH